jgi:hypothetical protein
LSPMKTAVSICVFALLVAGCAWPLAAPTPTAGVVVERAATEVPPTVATTPTAEPTPTAVPTLEPAATLAGPAEYPVTEIPLSGPVAKQSAEVSGMAWYGDTLILLPQYPDFAGQEGDGAVYALPKADLLLYLQGALPGPLEPLAIPFVAPGLAATIEDFEGYEAIAFLGDQAFLTIEASPGREMKGYLVSGTMAPDLSRLAVDTAVVTEIPVQARESNRSDETLLVVGGTIVTLYEVNGAALNASPVAHLFDTDLNPRGTVPFPQIEYRITDATEPDADGRFWAINYFFPGDEEQKVENEPLAGRYGQGPTHAGHEAVERLVEFQYSDAGIRLIDAPPIQLELIPILTRNWEGLVRLDDLGFLLVTDLFPVTILGFVPLPDGG